MFSIPKDERRDRMVLDARPANCLEETEEVWIASLASPQQFAHLFIDDDEVIRLYCEDLREFYHSFLISPERTRRNALTMEVAAHEVRHLKCYDSKLHSGHQVLVPCLKTMAMGDNNAVSFGQLAHLSVLLRTGKLTLDDFITIKTVPPRGQWLAGLMIDDLVLAERVKRLPLDQREPTECQEIISAVHAKYREVGLPRHAGKSVYNSSCASFWGNELDGDRGFMRPNYSTSGVHHRQHRDS